MATKVLPSADNEERIQSAKEKWQNPSDARRVITKLIGIPTRKSGIDLLVESAEHNHHHPNPWYMIHPNNVFRRYASFFVCVLAQSMCFHRCKPIKQQRLTHQSFFF